MSPDQPPEPRDLSPDDAFAALGNENRIKILQILGETDSPIVFSELKERVGMRDSGQFNYHLNKLRGHFVRKTERGYVLDQTGERVLEAVLSGTVTESPFIEPTEIDESCHLCGGSVAVSYHQEQVDIYCTECSGRIGASLASSASNIPDGFGWLGALPLPPTGIQDRSPKEVLVTAATLGQLEYVAASQGTCPRCSSKLTRELRACPDHNQNDEICSTCEHRREVLFSTQCNTCQFAAGGGAIMALYADDEFLTHLLAHDVNPIAPTSVMEFYGAIDNYTVEVQQSDDPSVKISHTLAGDTLTKTLGGEIPVTTNREIA